MDVQNGAQDQAARSRTGKLAAAAARRRRGGCAPGDAGLRSVRRLSEGRGADLVRRAAGEHRIDAAKHRARKRRAA